MSSVRLEIKDRVAHLTIARESALNSLNVEVLKSLDNAIEEITELCARENGFDEVRAVVIRGEGAKAFAAGADIKLMQSGDVKQVEAFLDLASTAFKAIELCAVPVIAAVQGFALGGGMELCLACDLIIAGRKAKFGQPEVGLGLIPGFGGTQRLCQRVGIGTAKRLILSGEIINAAEAYRLGIADYLCDEVDLDQKLSEVLEKITSKSPVAIACSKGAIERFYKDNKQAGLEFEKELFLSSFESEDAKEGLTAFVEKRDANFKGR
jgi:enoyl-CoA hydratase